MYDQESEAVRRSYQDRELPNVRFVGHDGTQTKALDVVSADALGVQSLARSLWRWLGLAEADYNPSRIMVRREGDAVVLRAMPLHFLDDPDYWVEGNGNVPVCSKCFPVDVNSLKPCAPNCLFTARGDGAPLVVDHLLSRVQLPTTAQRYFVIAYGPPASGKSSILEVLGRLLPGEFPQLDADHTVQVNVDRTFQEGPLAAVYAKARNYARGRSPLHGQRLYRYYRWVADQVADLLLNEALLQRYNVLWESTGESVAWTQREIARIRLLGYQVLLVFPLVGKAEIMRRLHARLDQEGAPDDEMDGKITKASKNLLTLMTQPACPHWVQERLKKPDVVCYPHRVIIYDNEVAPGDQTILFDSNAPSQTDVENLQRLVPDANLLAYLESVGPETQPTR
jgi:energy-coupling factor transporter ATP-binding protein EcfA2